MKKNTVLFLSLAISLFSFSVFADEEKKEEEKLNVSAAVSAQPTTPATNEEEDERELRHKVNPAYFQRKFPTGFGVTADTDVSVGGFSVGAVRFHEIGGKLDANVAAGAKITAFTGERAGDQRNRGALITNLTVQFGAISSELQLNFTKAFSRALFHKFKEQGDVQATELDKQPVPTTIEKLTAKWDILDVETSRGIVSVSVVAGRDQATPVGSFVSFYQSGNPAIQSDRVDQTDLVKVVLGVFRDTVIEFVTYGYDVIGYSGDRDRDFNKIEQEGRGSRAINIKHTIDDFFGGELTLYLSYASSEEGFVNVNRSLDRQRPAQETYAVGARYIYVIKALEGRVTAATEYVHQSNHEKTKDEDAVSGSLVFDSLKYPVSGYTTVDWQQTLFKDEDGVTWRLGIAYHLFENIDLFAELEYVDPKIEREKEDKLQVNFGIAVSPAPLTTDLTPDDEKRHE